MSAPADNSELTEREAADLSALADGSLDPARRAEVQAWVDASPERVALFERERRVVELLRDVTRTQRAPEQLRARLEAARPRAQAAARRRRLGWSTGLAGAVAAVAATLVLVLPGSAPTLVQASAVATLGAVQPAPPPDPQAPRTRLGTDVQEVYFPNWSGKGWHAIGQRADTIHGRHMTTVYYQWGRAKIAYTIVSTPALAQPNAPVSYVGGLALRTLTVNGRDVVTWQRDDHTCILSTAHDVAPAVLRGLAAWHPTTA
jgi:anti-sigma factor RsiW